MSVLLSLLMFLMMPRFGQPISHEGRGGAPAAGGSVHAFDDPEPCDGTDLTQTCGRIHIPIG